MEDSIDFQIDFESISSMPMPVIFESEPAQKTQAYVEIIQNDKKVYQCTSLDCGKIFKFKSEIKRHAIIHKSERPYSCTVPGCLKSFKRADTLENHMRLHDGSLPYPCDRPGCGKRFVSRSALRYHEMRHINNSINKSDSEECEQSFGSQQHQNTCGSVHYENSPVEIADEVEPEPYKIHKSENNEQLIEGAMKTNESIQWEVKTQIYEDTTSNVSRKEKLEMIFSYILQENKIMKEQLKFEKKSSKSPEKELECSPELENHMSTLGLAIPSNFFGEELNFLDFMQDEGSFKF